MTFSDTARKSPERMRKYADALRMRINRTEEEDVDPEAAATNVWLAIDACRMMIDEAQKLQTEFIMKLPMVQADYAERLEKQKGEGRDELLDVAKVARKLVRMVDSQRDAQWERENLAAPIEEIMEQIDFAIEKAEGRDG